MVVLDNGKIRIEIAELGAEIRRVTVDGEERFWNGDEKYWTGVAPVLFPICGGLKDKKYTVNGKEYFLENHGFARRMIFETESADENTAVFLLRDTPETLKVYPWHFELRVKYTLDEKNIRVEYDVKNLSDSTMYAAVGAHEAYLCPEGIEDYDIIFSENETLNSHVLDGCLLTRDTVTYLSNSKVLPIYSRYFDVDTLVFTDIKSRFVTLKNRKTEKKVSVEFNGFDNLLIWTKQGAPYLCIEPWTTCPSYTDIGYEISDKVGMTAIEPDGSFNKVHTIYFD